MKSKDKLVGSAALLILGGIFLIIGYYISNPQKVNNTGCSDIFAECDGVQYEVTDLYSVDDKVCSNNFNESKENNNNYITVDIKGAVVNPGAYKLEEGRRVEDLIKLADGFTEDAEKITVHLSKKLYDEDFVYIRRIGEEEVENIPINSGEHTENREKVNNNSNDAKYININTANIGELKELPGIGDVRAKNIMDYRQKNGNFSSIDELMNVDGIGEGIFNKLIGLVDIK